MAAANAWFAAYRTKPALAVVGGSAYKVEHTPWIDYDRWSVRQMHAGEPC